jgi:hypothetical protein
VEDGTEDGNWGAPIAAGMTGTGAETGGCKDGRASGGEAGRGDNPGDTPTEGSGVAMLGILPTGALPTGALPTGACMMGACMVGACMTEETGGMPGLGAEGTVVMAAGSITLEVGDRVVGPTLVESGGAIAAGRVVGSLGLVVPCSKAASPGAG